MTISETTVWSQRSSALLVLLLVDQRGVCESDEEIWAHGRIVKCLAVPYERRNSSIMIDLQILGIKVLSLLFPSATLPPLSIQQCIAGR